MDQVIFEEFKGTGNMELTLDRNLSNQRIYPALNIAESGTRKEEKLLSVPELAAARNIRRHLMNMTPPVAMKTLLDVLSGLNPIKICTGYKHRGNRMDYFRADMDVPFDELILRVFRRGGFLR